MKKLVLILLLAFCLFVVSCTPRIDGALPESSGDTTPTLSTDASLDLKVGTDKSNNYEAIAAVGTESGYYQMVESNIYYTDYATASRLPLCSTPNCEHSDDSCTSFFQGSGILFLDNEQEHLFYLGSNSSTDNIESDGQYVSANRDVLYRMELSGAGREIIYDFGTGAAYNHGTIATSTDSLYLIYATNENQVHKFFLGRIDLDSGNLTPVKEVENGEYIVSAFDNTIFIDNNGKVYKYDLSIGESTLVYEYSPQEKKVVFQDDKLYSYDISSGEIKLVNLTTGEESLIITLSGNAEISFIRVVHNNYLEIVGYNGEHQEKEIVDIAASKVYMIELAMQREWSADGEVSLPIIAANSQYILTAVKSEEQEVTAYDPGGVPYNTLVPINVTALITWDDFLNSNPEYLYIEDLSNITS